MILLKVNEIFGPTIQGEGYAAGTHCLFVRLANCNLECNWCDTPYTWAYTPEKAAKHRDITVYPKSANLFNMNSGEILNRLHDLWNGEPTLVVISGGEPLMQIEGLEELVQLLVEEGHQVHIETAGTIAPSPKLFSLVHQWNVSPKLAHSGNLKTKRIKSQVLKLFAQYHTARFKFVIRGVEDFFEVNEIAENHNIPNNVIQVMPEGTDNETLIERLMEIAPEAVHAGWGVSGRMHILAFGNERAT